jgi:hypothetical protein
MSDRFPEGLWGRSLAPSAGDYGHKEDPGSITVTFWGLRALAALSRSSVLPESAAFLSYLIARKSKQGAVGMRKFVGTEFADAYMIIEHARHTAVAANFLRENRALDHALDCVKFLVQRQHATGGWIDVESASDSKPDPVTTAYVLRTLLDFEKCGLLEQLRFEGSAAFAASYRKRGIHWLYEDLSENDNWWLYSKGTNPMSRAYGYTVDVLNILPEFADEDQRLRESHQLLLEKLANTWRQFGNGLPLGVGRDRPNLDASAQFVMTCWQHRAHYPHLAMEFVPSFLTNVEGILKSSDSNAAGWSLLLALAQSVASGHHCLPSNIEDARRQGNSMWDNFRSAGRTGAIQEISHRPDWVQKIVLDSILPVTSRPM